MALPAFIQQAYIAFFNRPADKEGFEFWETTDDPDQALLDLFAQSEEYLSDFEGKSSREIIKIVYQNLFGRDPEPEGWDYWEEMMDAGWVTVGNAAYEILGGAQGADLSIVNNKTEAALYFTNALVTTAQIDAYANAGDNGVGNVAKDWLAAVGKDAFDLLIAKGKVKDILTTLVDANTPEPDATYTEYLVDSIATSNTTHTLSTEANVHDTIKWDGTLNNGRLTVENFGIGEDYLDFTAYGALWLGAATLDAGGRAVTSLTNLWNADSAFPVDGLEADDTYITLTREFSSTTTMYKIELWTVKGDYADAFYGIFEGSSSSAVGLPLTEEKDTSQLIGYIDIGSVIDSSLLANINFLAS